MVDRLDKLNPSLPYRVDRSGEGGQRHQHEQEEEKKKKDKDKFDKKGRSWRRLLSDSEPGIRPNPLLAGRAPQRPAGPRTGGAPAGPDEREETSLTFSERVLVMWGILDRGGHPRVPVILTYMAVMGVMTVGSILIAVFLWR